MVPPGPAIGPTDTPLISGVGSSFKMVQTAWVSELASPLALSPAILLTFTSNVSSIYGTVSPFTVTEKILLVAPAAMLWPVIERAT